MTLISMQLANDLNLCVFSYHEKIFWLSDIFIKIFLADADINYLIKHTVSTQSLD